MNPQLSYVPRKHNDGRPNHWHQSSFQRSVSSLRLNKTKKNTKKVESKVTIIWKPVFCQIVLWVLGSERQEGHKFWPCLPMSYSPSHTYTQGQWEKKRGKGKGREGQEKIGGRRRTGGRAKGKGKGKTKESPLLLWTKQNIFYPPPA